MNNDKEFLKELTTKALYSTDLRWKPMTIDTLYNAITIIKKSRNNIKTLQISVSTR